MLSWPLLLGSQLQQPWARFSILEIVGQKNFKETPKSDAPNCSDFFTLGQLTWPDPLMGNMKGEVLKAVVP